MVAVGVYLNDISCYDQSSGYFNADFYLWFRWQENWTMGDVNSTVASAITLAQSSPTDNLYVLAEYALPIHFEFMNGQPTDVELISAQPNYNNSGYNFLEYRIIANLHDPFSSRITRLTFRPFRLIRKTTSIPILHRFTWQTIAVW